mmetsp:Transcript_11567/g.33289  ORF Transcript_11567/g.33289 Transcript_11567/m.33289 type:complete len:217 (+) Transcript_11567:470-1120(+)
MTQWHLRSSSSNNNRNATPRRRQRHPRQRRHLLPHRTPATRNVRFSLAPPPATMATIPESRLLVQVLVAVIPKELLLMTRFTARILVPPPAPTTAVRPTRLPNSNRRHPGRRAIDASEAVVAVPNAAAALPQGVPPLEITAVAHPEDAGRRSNPNLRIKPSHRLLCANSLEVANRQWQCQSQCRRWRQAHRLPPCQHRRKGATLDRTQLSHPHPPP